MPTASLSTQLTLYVQNISKIMPTASLSTQLTLYVQNISNKTHSQRITFSCLNSLILRIHRNNVWKRGKFSEFVLSFLYNS